MNKSIASDSYRQELKVKILEAAIHDFRINGIKSVKMDDIASKLSISKRTLYEIYKNKEDLLFECLRYHDTVFENQLNASIGPDSTVLDILISFMKLHIEENSKTNPNFFYEIGKYPKVIKYIEERNTKSRAKSVGFMKKGVEEGVFRDDIDFNISNLMAEVFMKYVMDNKLYHQYPIQVIFRNVVLVLLRGFCTNKGLAELDKAQYFANI